MKIDDATTTTMHASKTYLCWVCKQPNTSQIPAGQVQKFPS
jgi:hypothetical protein